MPQNFLPRPTHATHAARVICPSPPPLVGAVVGRVVGYVVGPATVVEIPSHKKLVDLSEACWMILHVPEYTILIAIIWLIKFVPPA